TWAGELDVVIDGARVPLRITHSTTSLPTEQGGFSLRVDADFTAPLTLDRAAPHTLTFANRTYAGRFGWNEIAVTTAAPWKAFDTNAFDTSLTAGLTEALQNLPATGPLQERTVHLQLAAGALPAGAVALGPRDGMANPASSATNAAPAADAGWLQTQTRRLVDLVAQRDPPLSITLLALLAAMLLGAVHAFSPGHGKTVVGAYLIGSRATARHAMFLGATVTITHTLGVFALGFATLLAANSVVPERLIPILSVLSGLLVLGMGVVLLVQRWPRRAVTPLTPMNTRSLVLSSARLRAAAPEGRPIGGALIARMSGYSPATLGHAHAGGGQHNHADGGHSHGGRWHTHLPPTNDDVSWRSLLALGVSGGLVPCPSALVILLAAVALNKTAYGLLLVLAFSAGLALTLMLVGLVFLYARHRLPSGMSNARWVRWLPMASAVAIVGVGALLCYAALTTIPA
ncbi:MAG: sulfite exporter TauE/SafE family protein, partial [Betaproteobacteria bacterium]